MADMDDGMRRFFDDLLDTAQFVFDREYLTGSRVEIERNEVSMQRFGLDVAHSCDVDRMEYNIDRYAFSLGQRVPGAYRGDVLRVLPNAAHPGYVRLVREASNTECAHITFPLQRLAVEDMHGPALKHSFKFDEEMLNELILQLNKSNCVSNVDRVAAIHCPYWPAEAFEWITRTRRHACPSKSVVKRVVRYGCDFVGVAHKLSCTKDEKNEYRFSFSVAELFIIRGWTTSQKIVYRALRLIFKIIEEAFKRDNKEDTTIPVTRLCTYYFKTLMLWACEEQPPEFWTDSSLVDTVRHLLVEMCAWLTAKHCPNYFIPGNNMMDHLTDVNVSSDVTALRRASESSDFLHDVIEGCVGDESLCARTKYECEFNEWMLAALLLLKRIRNGGDNYKDLFEREYSPELTGALMKTFQNVYGALRCQKEAFECDYSLHDANAYLETAEKYLSAATAPCEPCDARQSFSMNTDINSLFSAYFIRYDTSKQMHGNKYFSLFRMKCEIKDKNVPETKCVKRDIAGLDQLMGVRTNEGLTVVVEDDAGRSTEVARIGVPDNAVTIFKLNFRSEPCEYSGANESHTTDIMLYRPFKGVGPTLKMSWFVAKAYLANLHYTARRDYKTAVLMCDDIVKVCDLSLCNRLVAHATFPVLLSTRFAAVYDSYIQVILGFCSLCAAVSTTTERRFLPADPRSTTTERRSMHTEHRFVQFGVCPVRFAFYLKLRCLLSAEAWCEFNGCIANFKEHFDTCRPVTEYSTGGGRERAEVVLVEPLALTAASEAVVRCAAAARAARLAALLCVNAQREYAHWTCLP